MTVNINGTTGFDANATQYLVGQVCHFAQTTAPSGFILCDGSAISRTTYSLLFAEISTNYGVGDGSTTFNLPNLLGEFIRGWDNAEGNDPDAASRTDRGDGTTGDVVGAKQTHNIDAHTHDATTQQEGTGGAGFCPGSGAGASDITTQSTGGNETRPRNVGLLPAIFTGVI